MFYRRSSHCRDRQLQPVRHVGSITSGHPTSIGHPDGTPVDTVRQGVHVFTLPKSAYGIIQHQRSRSLLPFCHLRELLSLLHEGWHQSRLFGLKVNSPLALRKLQSRIAHVGLGHITDDPSAILFDNPTLLRCSFFYKQAGMRPLS